MGTPPNGCAECGVERSAHGTSWSASLGLHAWIEPSDAHRLARMKRNRDLRTPIKHRPLRRPAIGQVLFRKRDGIAVTVVNVDPSGLAWIRAAKRADGRVWPVKDLWRLYR